MTMMIDSEAKEDMLSRGFSRRDLARVTALLGAGAVLGKFSEPAFAQSQAARALVGGTRIGANECWTGPFEPAAQAAMAIVRDGNRYCSQEAEAALLKAVGEVEGIAPERVQPWPGSGDPLARTVLAFCTPEKGVVTGDPTFETVWGMGAYLGTKVSKVPLTADYRHDVKAMLAADPNAGMYYICTPNNPTGTLTPLEDIQWLIDNKPAGSVVVVDEAYIHWSPDAKSAIPLAATRDDVLVLRTFSKLFGMAGMRLGLSLGHPDLNKKVQLYGRGANLPVTAVACGTVAVTQADLIKARSAEMLGNLGKTLAHLDKRKIKYLKGSQANMFMIDWKTKTGKEMNEAFRAQNVQIGRSWAIWPTVSRVSVGSAEDMDKFTFALDKIIA